MLFRSRSLALLLLVVAPLAAGMTACHKAKIKPETRLSSLTDGSPLDAAANGGVAAAGAWNPSGAPGENGFDSTGSMNSVGKNGVGFDSSSIAKDSTGSIPNNANTTGIESGSFSSELEMIHFEYDKSDIADAWKPTLDKHAEWLAANPKVMVQVEGHCDERGTEEYNVALGQKRADAVRQYLADKGVDPNRLSTLSYGKERPLDASETDEAMATNRRAMFMVYQMNDNSVAMAQ
ncbi:hypothetical protein BH09SUM1_BH09SUM1_20440 [soil metagenome]